jgi:GMP synthase (glutamine-hydrolysing)
MAEKSCLVVRHVAFEHAGTFAGVLAERGHSVTVRDAGIDALAPAAVAVPDLLVVLGGPLGANDERTYPFLLDELALIERQARLDRPLLGIGLGAQLMARALGGRAYKGNVKEIGFSPLILTAEGRAGPLGVFGDAWPVLHWHGDTFDPPRGATLLAMTAHYRHQAFEIGPRTLGLQFHAEVEAHEIERWLIGHAVELTTARLDPAQIRAAARQFGDGLAARARRFLGQWLDRAEGAG